MPVSREEPDEGRIPPTPTSMHHAAWTGQFSLTTQIHTMTLFHSADLWVFRPRPVPAPRLRLFCLPYAGGGASIYRLWPNHLPGDVEVCALQLPGRERRHAEPAITDAAVAVELIAEALGSFLGVPFALFGHSMGASLAYETARRLQSRYGRPPLGLFASARRAPHLPPHKAPIHHLPDYRFIEEIRQLNGTPSAVLENAELMELMLPLLRADFRLVETYRELPGPSLTCPILAFGGTADTEASLAQLEAWKDASTGPFRLQMFPGDHFFLSQVREELVMIIARELEHWGAGLLDIPIHHTRS
jgi:medium-chain acyl-[acyl-carrier-protein] hydrolase